MGDAKGVSRRELIKGVSGAALVGGQAVQKQPAGGVRPQRKLGWPDYRQSAMKAMGIAHSLWAVEARLADVRIMAVSAIGGRLIGPDLTPLLQSNMTGIPANIAGGISRAIGGAWKEWAGTVTVPGLPWYPAFAAFPGPMAPPMPNVPTPLASLVSPGDTAFLPNLLVERLRRELGESANEPGADREITDLAYWLAANFALYKASAMVMLVMGKGPVPTFAPPYVPVGPVVNGDIISTPGHLMASSGFKLPALTYFDPRTQFEAVIGNAFKVSLQTGAAGLQGSSAYLFGDVLLTPAAGGDVKVLVRGAEMALSLSNTRSRGLLQQATAELERVYKNASADGKISSFEKKKLEDTQKQADTVASQVNGLRGSGRLEVQVGSFSFSIPGAHFEIDPQGRLSLVGGAVNLKGITHSVGKGSYISGSEARLTGFAPLVNYALTDSYLSIRPNGITGAGKLQAFAHTFNLSYDLNGPSLRAGAEAGGPDRGWQSLPFVNGAQYRVNGAKIRVEVNGTTVSASVRGGQLSVRTTATKPDGAPWSVSTIDISPELAASVNGDVRFPAPRLVQAADPLRADRAACESAAKAANSIPDVPGFLAGDAKKRAEEARDKAVSALNNALAKCREKYPSPPPLPTMPDRFTVKVGNLVG